MVKVLAFIWKIIQDIEVMRSGCMRYYHQHSGEQADPLITDANRNLTQTCAKRIIFHRNLGFTNLRPVANILGF
jgi:hypothetical protein